MARDLTATEAIETKFAFDAIATAAFLLNAHRRFYEALEKQHRHMDNVGGLIDPSFYRQMNSSDRYAANKAVADAALAFLRSIDAVPSWAEALAINRGEIDPPHPGIDVVASR